MLVFLLCWRYTVVMSYKSRPYIARDTGEPLVVMGHYRINEHGGIIREPIRQNSKPEAKEDDISLLNEHGEDGLIAMQYHGVLDRLRTSGLIR